MSSASCRPWTSAGASRIAPQLRTAGASSTPAGRRTHEPRWNASPRVEGLAKDVAEVVGNALEGLIAGDRVLPYKAKCAVGFRPNRILLTELLWLPSTLSGSWLFESRHSTFPKCKHLVAGLIITTEAFLSIPGRQDAGPCGHQAREKHFNSASALCSHSSAPDQMNPDTGTPPVCQKHGCIGFCIAGIAGRKSALCWYPVTIVAAS